MKAGLLPILFILPMLCPCESALAQHAGEHISPSGDINDDVYVAGGQVDLYATVNGDVVAAGGQLDLEGLALTGRLSPKIPVRTASTGVQHGLLVEQSLLARHF